MFSKHGLAHLPAAGEGFRVAQRPSPPQWIGALLDYVARRLQPAGGMLRVEERLTLGGRRSVTLIACQGRRFLLVSSGDAIAPLVEVRPLDGVPLEPAPDQEGA